MKLPETWKQAIKEFKTTYKAGYILQQEEETVPGSSVHSTPAGLYPKEGPQPGKLGIVFYLTSVCLCIFGTLSLARCSYAPDDDRFEILIFGLILILAGLVFLHIANYIYNKEHQALITYLQAKVEEFRTQHERNIQGIPPPDETV